MRPGCAGKVAQPRSICGRSRPVLSSSGLSTGAEPVRYATAHALDWLLVVDMRVLLRHRLSLVRAHMHLAVNPTTEVPGRPPGCERPLVAQGCPPLDVTSALGVFVVRVAGQVGE